ERDREEQGSDCDEQRAPDRDREHPRRVVVDVIDEPAGGRGIERGGVGGVVVDGGPAADADAVDRRAEPHETPADGRPSGAATWGEEPCGQRRGAGADDQLDRGRDEERPYIPAGGGDRGVVRKP